MWRDNNCKFLILLLLAVCIAGCSFLTRTPQVQTKYVLSKLNCAAALKSGGPGIIVASPRGPSFITGNNIIFAKSANIRAAYKYSSWALPFSDQLAEMLTRDLECSGAFRMVTHTSPGARAQYLLNTELNDLYHDASAQPGKIVISARFEILDLPTREILASHLSQIEVPVEQPNAQAAVSAYDAAVLQLLNEVREWVISASVNSARTNVTRSETTIRNEESTH